MNKKLYIGFSYVEFFWALLLKIVFVSGIIYFIINYNENPVLMGILAVLCLSFLLLTGDDQIVVYQDRIIQTNSSLFSSIFKPKDKTIYIQQINTAYTDPDLPLDKSGAVIIALLKFIVAKPLGYSTKSQSIFFQLKNDSIVSLETRLAHKDVIKIIEIVNSQVKKLPQTTIDTTS